MDFFSVDTIAFTLFDYPLSYIELIGTVLYLLSVWLIARRNMLTWPIGIISVILYMILFYQIRLYADALEQVYYLGASAYGWWLWRKTTQTAHDANPKDTELSVFYSSVRTIILVIIGTIILSGLTGLFISNAHDIIPSLFPEPAAVPYLDAVTTVMSFTAMLMMAQKRTESWIYWIIVDVIGIGLYFSRDVVFISLLYVVLLVIAINGFISWNRFSNKDTLTTEVNSTT